MVSNVEYMSLTLPAGHNNHNSKYIQDVALKESDILYMLYIPDHWLIKDGKSTLVSHLMLQCEWSL